MVTLSEPSLLDELSLLLFAEAEGQELWLNSILRLVEPTGRVHSWWSSQSDFFQLGTGCWEQSGNLLIVLGKFINYSTSLEGARPWKDTVKYTSCFQHIYKLTVTKLVDFLGKPFRNWLSVSQVFKYKNLKLIFFVQKNLSKQFCSWGKIVVASSQPCHSCQESRWLYMLIIFIESQGMGVFVVV